jgi:hypothetical protein
MKREDVTLAASGDLYCIPCGDGFTCLGYDVCLKWGNDYAKWLNERGVKCQPIPPELRGTLKAYRLYRMLADAVVHYCSKNNTSCDTQLTGQLIGYEGKRVEVVDCHGEKRRFWVGRSWGPIKIHLEISRRNSIGGHRAGSTDARR